MFAVPALAVTLVTLYGLGRTVAASRRGSAVALAAVSVLGALGAVLFAGPVVLVGCVLFYYGAVNHRAGAASASFLLLGGGSLATMASFA